MTARDALVEQMQAHYDEKRMRTNCPRCGETPPPFLYMLDALDPVLLRDYLVEIGALKQAGALASSQGWKYPRLLANGEAVATGSHKEVTMEPVFRFISLSDGGEGSA